MTSLDLKHRVEELLHAYVQCIDDDDLENWPDFFTEDAVYRVIPRENFDRGLPVSTMYCNGKGMLKDRVLSLRTANVYAKHYYRHLVSNTRVLGEANGTVAVQTNYAVMQTLLDGDSRVYNTGRYLDQVVEADGGLKFKEKLAICDTYRVQTLLVTPI